MKKFFIKEIASGILIIFVLVSMTFSAYPKKVEAQGYPVMDILNYVENFVTNISVAASEVYDYAIKNKEFVLDPLANAAAKMVIQSVTSSIVNWINSGFEGSPSFVQNPGAFFIDLADQATGQFISNNGFLSSLCSPFSIDIRLALSFKYHPNVQKRYACTLSTVIKNSVSAGKNASINGFTAGDFKQGGWPAFVSLTTEPQNNIYGAYLQAESDLSFKVASIQIQQKDELTQGRGFLSRKVCKTVPDDTGDTGPTAGTQVCEIQTPGSVIAGALDTQLGSPVRQLELADEFGEIVNALFSQLVVKVLQGGLAGSSQKNSSGQSYLDQTRNELNTNNPQIAAIKEQLLSNIGTYQTRTAEYKKNRDDALQIMLNVKNAYDAAKQCYVDKAATSSNLTAENKAIAQSRINEIDAIIAKDVAPKLSQLQVMADDAKQRMDILQNVVSTTNAATTVDELNGPSEQYNSLIQNGGLTTARELGTSKTDPTTRLGLTEVTEDGKTMLTDANKKLGTCQGFPANLTSN